MTTISDIAKLGGVSPAVVSRIINGDKKLRVSQETRERIEAIVKETGYTPNAAARSLRKAKTGVLALVVHDVTNPVYAEIIAGAQEAASEHDKIVLIGDADSLGVNVERIERMIAGGAIDGLILQGAGTELDRAIEHAVSRKVPLVFLQSGDIELAPILRTDDETAGHLATSHLIEHGHRDIGLISTHLEMQFSRARLAGWRRALQENGLEAEDDSIVFAHPSYKSGYEAAVELFKHKPETSAIVVSNVMSAVGALSLLKDIGKKVPEDVSIVGINNADVIEYVRPALTCVQLPLRATGEEAVRMICNGEDLPKKELKILEPAPKLIARSSVTHRKIQQKIT